MFNLDDELIQYRKRATFFPVLVIGVQSDILYPVWQQRELAQMLRSAGKIELDDNSHGKIITFNQLILVIRTEKITIPN